MKIAFDLATKEIGTFEWGDGSNPRVLGYFKDAGHGNISDDAVPWCAAFVGAMLVRAGMPSTGRLDARSYLKWGKSVLLRDAQQGDIVVFARGNSSWQGHVGFYVSQTDNSINVLGGNQADQVNTRYYGKAKLLGVRRGVGPKTAPQRPDVSFTPPKTWWEMIIDFFKRSND